MAYKMQGFGSKAGLPKKEDKEMMADGSVQEKKTTQTKDYLNEKANDDSQTNTLSGQFLKKTSGGYKDIDSGKVYSDPNNVIKVDKEGLVVDNDYIARDNKIIKEL